MWQARSDDMKVSILLSGPTQSSISERWFAESVRTKMGALMSLPCSIVRLLVPVSTRFRLLGEKSWILCISPPDTVTKRNLNILFTSWCWRSTCPRDIAISSFSCCSSCTMEPTLLQRSCLTCPVGNPRTASGCSSPARPPRHCPRWPVTSRTRTINQSCSHS